MIHHSCVVLLLSFFPFNQGQARFLHDTCHALTDTYVVQSLVQDHRTPSTRMERLRTSPVYVRSCVFLFFVCYAQALQVEFDPGCEAMIYTTEGTPLQGLVFLSLVHFMSELRRYECRHYRKQWWRQARRVHYPGRSAQEGHALFCCGSHLQWNVWRSMGRGHHQAA